jgi:hypothetical protein
MNKQEAYQKFPRKKKGTYVVTPARRQNRMKEPRNFKKK